MLPALLILLSGVLFTGCINDNPEVWSLNVGDRLPAFSVVTSTGEIVSDSSFSDSKGAIIFFSTVCGDCKRELPLIDRQYRRLRSLPEMEHFLLICISRGEDSGTVMKFWEDYGLEMPVAVADAGVYYLFASSGVPRMYVVGSGLIRDVFLEKFPSDPFGLDSISKNRGKQTNYGLE